MNRRALIAIFALLVAFVQIVACGHASPPAGKEASPASTPIQPTSSAPVAAVAATSSAPPSPASEEDLPIPIRGDDPVRGHRNAYVTLVVFSNFQCGFCAYEARTLQELRSKYGPDSLRIVFKHHRLPFHDKAAHAAEVAAGVMELGGSDAFWAFHKIAFERSSSLSEGEAVAWAAEVGVPERALKAGLESHRWRNKVESDMALAKSLGVVAAPTAFVNGVIVRGVVGEPNFEDVIEPELAKARSLAAGGVGRDAVYGRRLVANLEAKSAPKDEPDEARDRAIYRVPVGSAPTSGPSTALVTIVQFSDFQCPPCSGVSATLERIRAEYGAIVRFVWKDTPSASHARAMPAANFARSARAQKGNAAFWSARERLLADQTHLEDSDLEKLARLLGLDPQVTMGDVRRNAFKKEIDADLALAKTLKVTQTPHFFINGRRFVGAQPFLKFKVVVDEERERAEAMLKRGVSGDGLYDALTKPVP